MMWCIGYITVSLLPTLLRLEWCGMDSHGGTIIVIFNRCIFGHLFVLAHLMNNPK